MSGCPGDLSSCLPLPLLNPSHLSLRSYYQCLLNTQNNGFHHNLFTFASNSPLLSTSLFPSSHSPKGIFYIHDFKDDLDLTHERAQERFLLRNAHVWGLKGSHAEWYQK